MTTIQVKPGIFTDLTIRIDRAAKSFINLNVVMNAGTLRQHFLAEIGREHLDHYDFYLTCIRSWLDSKRAFEWSRILLETAKLDDPTL
jgi:hypothetical protein